MRCDSWTCGPVGLVVPLALAVLVALAIPEERRIFEAFIGKPAGRGSWRDLVALLVFGLWVAIASAVVTEPPRTLGGFVLGLAMVGLGIAAFAFLRQTARSVTAVPGLADPERVQVEEAVRRGVRLEEPELAEAATQVARGMSAWRAVALASEVFVLGVVVFVLVTSPELRGTGWLWLVVIVGFVLFAGRTGMRLRNARRAWRLNKR